VRLLGGSQESVVPFGRDLIKACFSKRKHVLFKKKIGERVSPVFEAHSSAHPSLPAETPAGPWPRPPAASPVPAAVPEPRAPGATALQWTRTGLRGPPGCAHDASILSFLSRSDFCVFSVLKRVGKFWNCTNPRDTAVGPTPLPPCPRQVKKSSLPGAWPSPSLALSPHLSRGGGWRSQLGWFSSCPALPHLQSPAILWLGVTSLHIFSPKKARHLQVFLA